MSLWSDARERVRALFLQTREERELAEELEFHREEAIEENLRRGMSLAEARRQAAIRLGGIERTKEDVRDARGTRAVMDLLRDLQLAARGLFKERGFSLPAAATIAVGIGVTSAAFALVNTVLLRPLPYPDSDRLVEVRHSAAGADLAVSGLSPGTFVHYRDRNLAFEEMAVFMNDARILTDAGEPEQVRLALISAGFFSTLRAAPEIGDLPAAGALADQGVVLSHDLWVRRYGADPEIVGKTIELDREPHRVAGVTRPGFRFPHPETQVWVTARMEQLLERFGRQAAVGSLFLSGIARLKPDLSTERAGEDLNRLVAVLPEVFPDVTVAELDELKLRTVVSPLRESLTDSVRPGLLLLGATAAVLLLITWANTGNLSLLRAERQAGEIAVRRALGATTGRLVQRFVSETLLLAAVGGIAGFVLAAFAVEARLGFQIEQIPRLEELALDGAVAVFAAGVALLTALLLAAVPLANVRHSSISGGSAGALRSVTSDGRRSRLRGGLVAGQVALALTLLITCGLLVQTYARLTGFDLGFKTDGGITFLLPLPQSVSPDRPASARLHGEILRRLRALPGVEGVETASVAAFPLTPVPDYFSDRVSAVEPDFTTDTPARALFSFATPGYFRQMGIRVLQGRSFERDAAVELPEAVLSARLARQLFGRTDPIGRRIHSVSTGSREYRVVGVAGDVPSRTIRQGAASVLYLANHSAAGEVDGESAPLVALRSEQYLVRTRLPLTSVVPAIRRAVDEVDPKLAMTGVQTLTALVSDSLAPARLMMLLLVAGAATALFLGLVGIYGVLSYSVRRRHRELGVRIALGADPGGLVAMVLRQGASLTAVGIGLGLAAALAISRFLETLLYEVSPADPWVYSVAIGLLAAVASAATYLPARRAAGIDPVQALKTE